MKVVDVLKSMTQKYKEVNLKFSNENLSDKARALIIKDELPVIINETEFQITRLRDLEGSWMIKVFVKIFFKFKLIVFRKLLSEIKQSFS